MQKLLKRWCLHPLLNLLTYYLFGTGDCMYTLKYEIINISGLFVANGNFVLAYYFYPVVI